MSTYAYNVEEGSLIELQTLDTLPPDVPESSVADIHISPSGQHIYVSNRGHNSLAIYEIAVDGRLTLLNISSYGGNWPRNFAISPDGRFILVANRFSNEVSVLPLSAGSAHFGTPLAGVSVAEPSCIQFSPL